MNQTNLSFESENLVVDWIGFNIQGSVDVQPIANYLFQSFGFNSTIANGSNGKEEYFIYDARNQFKVSFRQYDYNPESKKYWTGTKVIFSGKNASYLYRIIKAQKFDWNIFDLRYTSLSRFDLYYLRKSQISETHDQVAIFMEQSCQKIFTKSKRRKAKWGRETKGFILRIGGRTSSNYYRVYETNQGLKFELELKNELVKSFQKFLFDNNIEVFEHKLTLHFYQRSFDSIILNNCYTDWLLDWLRKSSEKQGLTGLRTSYLESNILNSHDEKELIFNLFRFLSFIQKRKMDKKSLNEQIYYLITFPVMDLVIHMQLDQKNPRHRKKVLDMVHRFQKLGPIIETFSDTHFKSSIMFPSIVIRKKGRIWVVNMAVGEQLLSYKYPYHFTDYFTSWKDKYQCQVKFLILQTITTYPLEKPLPVQDFLKLFNVPNKKQTEIKELILESLNELIKSQIIKSQFKIIQKDGSVSLIENNKLNPQWITKSKIIYLEEIVHYKDLFNPKN